MIQLTEFQSAWLWNCAIVLSFFGALMIQWRESRSKGIEPRILLTVLALLYASFIIGMRLGALSSSEWALWFESGTWPERSGKTALGGLFIALPIFLLLKKVWRLPTETSDILVLGLPLAAGISRIGCFFAGCCYGTPNQALGVCYAPYTPAYQDQLAAGAIDQLAAFSQPVFPVQLLLSLLSLAAFFYLWRKRNTLERPGMLAMQGLMLMAAIRFGVEFFRSPEANHGFSGYQWYGLKVVQWICLAFISVLAFLYRRRFGRTAQAKTAGHERPSPVYAPSFLLLMLTLTVLLAKPLFRMDEIISIQLICIPAILLTASFLRQHWLSGQKHLSPTLTLAMAGLITLGLPLDSIPLNKGNFPRKRFEVGGGYTSGAFQDIETRVNSCSGTSTTTRDNYKYKSGALELRYRNEKSESENWEAGLKGTWGETNVKLQYSDAYKTRFNSIAPFIGINTRILGAEAGIMNLHEQYTYDPLSFPISNKKDTKWVPSFHFRLGRLSQYSCDIRLYNGPSFIAYPNPWFSMGMINWGFNDPSGDTKLSIGMSMLRNEAAFYSGLKIPVWQKRLLFDGSVVIKQSTIFSLGLRYNFNLKN